MAGYSKRPLQDKLGIKPGQTITLINYPSGYEKTLGKLPASVIIGPLEEGKYDFIHYFTHDKQELQSMFPMLKKHLKPTGMLWISWPKLSSKIVSNLNENDVRSIGLYNDLVDVKVAAIDEIWSGLKFVYRLKDRS